MTPDRIEGLTQQLVEAGADAPFRQEDLLHFFVPLWVVRAYVEARYARRDVPYALAVEMFGEAEATLCRSNPKLLIWTLARGWAVRLGELERKVRGLSKAAA